VPEVYVGEVADFVPSGRRIVRSGNLEIGVMQRGDRFYAYRNVCLHQGGPACEGMIIARVEDVIADDQTYLGQRFDENESHFVCPWHGYEYDLETGECVPDRRKKLQKFDVLRKGESVYVVV
jgi:nitrite reductase/ring-hydroxylating ferredoxin subunit